MHPPSVHAPCKRASARLWIQVHGKKKTKRTHLTSSCSDAIDGKERGQGARTKKHVRMHIYIYRYSCAFTYAPLLIDMTSSKASLQLLLWFFLLSRLILYARTAIPFRFKLVYVLCFFPAALPKLMRSNDRNFTEKVELRSSVLHLTQNYLRSKVKMLQIELIIGA